MVRITSLTLMKILHPFRKGVMPRATSLAFFIIFRDEEVAASQRTNVHEMIHFFQQLEMLFIGQWVMYAYFYIRGRIKCLDHQKAYWANPFELEAHANDEEIEYLIKRKPYAWVHYIN